KAAYGERKKYIKVPVSDRLPEKGINSILLWNENPELVAKGYVSKFGNLIIHGNVDYEGKPDLYLEEVPDHSEEMLSLLQRILDLNILPDDIDNEVISLTLKAQGYDMGQIDKISQQGFEKTQQLINKVKDNGTRI
ncbi:hypothetical protein CMT20_19350, partial [Elizabethkingia anophelis]|nr:hypothetical protein [Elizabethkingia anophelis]